MRRWWRWVIWRTRASARSRCRSVEANGGYGGVLYVLGGLLTLAALLLFSLKPFPKSFPQQGQAQASSPA